MRFHEVLAGGESVVVHRGGMLRDRHLRRYQRMRRLA
jgi:hypothetical protein